VHVYRKTINSINIFKVMDIQMSLLNRNIERIQLILLLKEKRGYDGILNSVEFEAKFSGKKLKRILEQVNTSSQIIIQIFLSKIKYNLPKDFSARLEEYLGLLSFLIKEIHVHRYEQVIALGAEKESIEFYDTILQKTNLLLSNTTKNLWTEDTEKIVNFYQSTIPGIFQTSLGFYEEVCSSDFQSLSKYVAESKQRLIIYYKNINTVINILSANNHQDNLMILKMLMDQSNDSYEYIDGTNIFTIYFSLMTQAVLKNDVKLLTNVTNLGFQLAESEYNLYKDEDLIEASKKRYSLSKIMILNIVKAIELGHYSCAGFLIKMSTNQLENHNLNRNCYDVYSFVKNNNENMPNSLESSLGLDINPELLRKIGPSISFSPISFDYCYSKAMFLIYCQQEYLKAIGIKVITLSEILKVEDFIKDTNMVYLKNKVSGLNKEYGLSFLSDQNEKYLKKESLIII
ncbi:hypothetical protein, partial [Bacillus sp. JJ1562]|uniref:hypothetical protein n=1 Tax=Bacillus sp. JJ1562 TaxID=3122960 RepID=UPI0030010E35